MMDIQLTLSGIALVICKSSKCWNISTSFFFFFFFPSTTETLDLCTTNLWSGVQAETRDFIQNDRGGSHDALRSWNIEDDIVDGVFSKYKWNIAACARPFFLNLCFSFSWHSSSFLSSIMSVKLLLPIFSPRHHQVTLRCVCLNKHVTVVMLSDGVVKINSLFS